MSNKVCEVIPFKTFRERIRLTKSFQNKGITSIENLGNSLLIYYNTKASCLWNN